jgi:hypothetical protein
MTDTASQPNTSNEGGEVPTAPITQTTDAEATDGRKSVVVDRADLCTVLAGLKALNAPRFEHLGEAMGRLNATLYPPEVPKIGPQGSETASEATQLPGDAVSASGGAEIVSGISDASRKILDPLYVPGEKLRAAMSKPFLFSLQPVVYPPEQFDSERPCPPIDWPQEQQRATFEAIADKPRPTAVEIKEALETLERHAVNFERAAYPGHGEDMRHYASMIDSLAVHCLALEIERDGLTAQLDRIAEQAKPVDGTTLAALVQTATLHLEKMEAAGIEWLPRAKVMRGLIGAVNDQARKLAAFEIGKGEDPAGGMARAADAISAYITGKEPAEHWTGIMSRLRWACVERTKERDRMEVERDAATDVVKDLEFDRDTARTSLDNANRIIGELKEERDRETALRIAAEDAMYGNATQRDEAYKRADAFEQDCDTLRVERDEARAELVAAVEDRDKADAARGRAVRDHRNEVTAMSVAVMAALAERDSARRMHRVAVEHVDQIEAAFVKECARTAKLKRKLRKVRRYGQKRLREQRTYTDDARQRAADMLDGSLPVRLSVVDDVAKALGLQRVGQ